MLGLWATQPQRGGTTTSCASRPSAGIDRVKCLISLKATGEQGLFASCLAVGLVAPVRPARPAGRHARGAKSREIKHLARGGRGSGIKTRILGLGDSCGASPATACKTFARALSRCSPSSCNVLAMFGAYALPATLAFSGQTTPAGARLVGGCVSSEQAGAGLTSQISAPPGGAPAISVDRVKPVALENFKILGSTAAGTNASPAVTMQIANSPEVVLTNSLVVGGKGGTGAPIAARPAGPKAGNAATPAPAATHRW